MAGGPAVDGAGSLDDFDFGLMVIRVRRQVKRLGKEYVFALPKNDKERFVPMAPMLAKSSPIERLGVNIKELSEYLGHYYPGFTLQIYTHMLPSSYDRARQAVNRRLERLALRLTEQSRSRADRDPDPEDLERGPDLL